MATRDRLIADVRTYLAEHFPDAQIAVKKDGLTANEVFTITEGATTRHVEVSKRWLDGQEPGLPLPRAIREWQLAREVRGLQPNAMLRVGPGGFEPVA